MTPAVTITSAAKKQFEQELSQTGGSGQACVRLSVASGNCNGMNYTLDFMDSPLPQDVPWEAEGIRFCTPAFAAAYMNDLSIDYDAAGDEWVIRTSQPGLSAC